MNCWRCKRNSQIFGSGFSMKMGEKSLNGGVVNDYVFSNRSRVQRKFGGSMVWFSRTLNVELEASECTPFSISNILPWSHTQVLWQVFVFQGAVKKDCSWIFYVHIAAPNSAIKGRAVFYVNRCERCIYKSGECTSMLEVDFSGWIWKNRKLWKNFWSTYERNCQSFFRW